MLSNPWSQFIEGNCRQLENIHDHVSWHWLVKIVLWLCVTVLSYFGLPLYLTWAGFHAMSYVSLCLFYSIIVSSLFLFQVRQDIFIFSSVCPAHAINEPQLWGLFFVVLFVIQKFVFHAGDLSHFTDWFLSKTVRYYGPGGFGTSGTL